MEKLASERLEPGAVYTRGDLRALFEIHDATLNNGIFRPRGYDSVWLFVTERKTPDRTQYIDTLTGDTLHMEGQLKGRTDTLILEHRKRGLELLVFHRKAKYEHPGAGFRYEGAFTYESHSGGNPTSFVLRRKHTADGDTITAKIERELDTQGVFNPGDISDARERTLASIVRRRGQPRFRKQLLKAYQGRCAVTGCTLEPILEAAHIHPYLGDETNVVSNGLLLRTDVHTLFDLGLLWIEPHSLRVRLSEQLRHSEYSSLEGQSLMVPENEPDRPSRPALEFRLNTQRNDKAE
ncbi:TPA: HNH endonuclease [Pseudomonas aeruginosa]|uniref:HNH endonuclease n=1 Tax=Pseudomonas aeruginosa TaxID=287 RepID=UPI001EE1F6E8|nr:HNH endonuclease signature motif containing protein [Pseudomonas aeruginosa]